MADANFGDFRLVLADARRADEKIRTEGLRALSFIDALSELRDPDTNRSMHIGKDGRTAFWRVVRRVLKAHADLKLRVSEESMQRALARHFVNNLATTNVTLTKALTREIIQAAISDTRAQLIAKVKYTFPCVLAHDAHRDAFAIGPIKFFKRDLFLVEHKQKIEAAKAGRKASWRASSLQPSPFDAPLQRKDERWPALRIERIVNKKFTRVEEYFKKYRWVASVELARFDDKRSREVAQLCIETALNILRLFIGASHAEKFRIGGGYQLEEESVVAVETDEGSLDFWHSWTKANANIGDRWIELRLEGEAEPWVQMAGSLINGMLSGEEMPLIYRRYVIALWWYGEAVSEPHRHAKIVRYATALEAMLGTPPKTTTPADSPEKITERLARRGASLVAGEDQPDFRAWYQDLKQFYRMRSRLVHGEYAPFDKKIDAYADLGERLASRVLIEGLAWTLRLARRDYKMGIDELTHCFDNMRSVIALGEVPS
jgi:hypothetical protein